METRNEGDGMIPSKMGAHTIAVVQPDEEAALGVTVTYGIMVAVIVLAAGLSLLLLSGCGGGGDNAGDPPFCDTTTAEGKVCAEELK